MSKIVLALVAVIVTGTSAASTDALAQGATTPQSQSMGASRSGSAIDSDQGKGGIPTDVSKEQFDKGFTGQAPGIGEKGSGQGRSTLEREGGKQGLKEERAQSSDLSQGKTAQAMEKQAHDERNR